MSLSKITFQLLCLIEMKVQTIFGCREQHNNRHSNYMLLNDKQVTIGIQSYDTRNVLIPIRLLYVT